MCASSVLLIEVQGGEEVHCGRVHALQRRGVEPMFPRQEQRLPRRDVREGGQEESQAASPL